MKSKLIAVLSKIKKIWSFQPGAWRLWRRPKTMFPNVWVVTQTGSSKYHKMGRAGPGDPKTGRTFSTLALLVYVYNGDICEKSIFLKLKGNSVIYCQNSSIQSAFFSYAVWDLGREVFTKLWFGSRSKRYGNCCNL